MQQVEIGKQRHYVDDRVGLYVRYRPFYFEDNGKKYITSCQLHACNLPDVDIEMLLGYRDFSYNFAREFECHLSDLGFELIDDPTRFYSWKKLEQELEAELFGVWL